MSKKPPSKETIGAWIIHHGQKTVYDVNGPAEFPVIDTAAKASSLLSQISASNENEVSNLKLEAFAKAARLNPKTELPSLLGILESQRLIDRSQSGVAVLGLTSRAVLGHAADIFEEQGPSIQERAAIDLAEVTSKEPAFHENARQYIADNHKLSKQDTAEFLTRAETIGFVDSEGSGNGKLYFNGHLFRREQIQKTAKVMASLSDNDRSKATDLDDLISKSGCVGVDEAKKILGEQLFQKLMAASLYDQHYVQNGGGLFGFVTVPAAFHKFVDPLVDDAFDLAKALVAALTYGITQSAAGRGRIVMVDALLRKLILGAPVGPATAIGEDYKVLEEKGVISVTPQGGLYNMTLLKKDIGEIALQVLTKGNASAKILDTPPPAAMTGYVGPEKSRTNLRRSQSAPSKKLTRDVLEALRTRGGLS